VDVDPAGSAHDDLAATLEYGRTAARGVFAGAEVDADDHGVVVGFTDNLDDHVTRLTALLADPSRLRPFRARRTLEELEKQREQIDRDIACYTFKQDGFTVSSSHIDIPQNAIVWDVFAADPESARRELRTRYGDVLTVSVLGSADTVTEPWACSSYELLTPTTLRVTYSALTSSTLAAVEAESTDERVYLTVLLHQYLGATALEIRPARAEVTLAEPLGDRQVVDAVKGKVLPRRPMRSP
jgi:hypothetical protein